MRGLAYPTTFSKTFEKIMCKKVSDFLNSISLQMNSLDLEKKNLSINKPPFNFIH
jgi:hypothetical protein